MPPQHRLMQGEVTDLVEEERLLMGAGLQSAVAEEAGVRPTAGAAVLEFGVPDTILEAPEPLVGMTSKEELQPKPLPNLWPATALLVSCPIVRLADELSQSAY